MKRIPLIMCLILVAHLATAQVVSFDMIERNANTDVRLTLKDLKSSEPISWASVYLIPAGDTTITHFALSDEKGDVLLKEVPAGKYEVNAEMIGYNPHKKVYTIKPHWDAFDLGIIKLEENAEYLDAASISAVGNPIVVKKDTIEFNASSFKVGENAMLEDLLKKMPGMEVSDDGTVTLNGEKIDKITVGGKTFFFNDPTAALKNLPAKIVDKIKVVDKAKDEAAASGIVTRDDKEKVMDVELKEEFTKGWYGNAKIGGGSTLTPDNGSTLTDDRGLLYNGNAMVTGYTEKDQVILIGNAYNALEPGASTAYISNGTDSDFNSLGGLNSSAQAGINFNTSRIKGMESTVNVNYKNNGKVARRESSRTTFIQDAPDMVTEGAYDSKGGQNVIGASVEIKAKENDKYYLYIRPDVGYATESISTSNVSETSSEGLRRNRSEAATSSTSGRIYTTGGIYAGLKELGKKNRSVSIGLEYDFSDMDKTSHETSMTEALGQVASRDLFYDTDTRKFTGAVRFNYSEPISDRWTAAVTLSSQYNGNTSIRKATDPDGTYNDYYSSLTDNRYLSERGSMTVQYSNDTSTVQFGVRLDAVQNEIRARSMGVETVTGKGEWLTNWAPFLTYQYEKDNTSIYAGYYGQSSQPSSSLITPALNISNPVQITAGNIYLKPQYTNGLYAGLSSTNRETFAYLGMYMGGSMATRSTVYASWMDESGIRYAVPVNAQKPVSNCYAYISYNRPLGKERKFTLTAAGEFNFSGGHSYQAVNRTEGLDLQKFDYNDFMKDFWGNADGNRFYSGESGFAESRTNSFNWGAQLQLKYSIDKLDATLAAGTTNRISRYSLDPTADMNTWTSTVGGDILYQPGKGWEIGTNLKYRFYNGFTSGFGAPEWQWDANISKSIKSVTLGLKVADILNQTRSLNRTVSAEYMEDVYNNVLGRFFLFSVSFNFGKMNARKNKNVEGAMWNML